MRPCGVINGAENLVGAFVARCRNVVGAPPTVLRTLRCHRRMIERGVTVSVVDIWPRGPMDKASAYGARDCRFESCPGHFAAASVCALFRT